MKLKNALLTGMSLVLVTALSIFSVGCSGDDNNNATGPSPTPGVGTTYDEITVSLNTLYVKYDCDYDPAGVTQPGDFRYSLNVDTLSDDGSAWLKTSSNKEASADINTGSTKNISGQSASFRLPRMNGQAFRVRMTLREADPNGKNDFSSNRNVTHIYSPAASQMYAPDGTNFTSWNNATKVGKMAWNVNKRDRSWVLGVLTKEGCNATLNYSVSVREVI